MDFLNQYSDVVAQDFEQNLLFEQSPTTKNTKNKEKQKWKKVVQLYSIETKDGFTLYSLKLQDFPWREDFTKLQTFKVHRHGGEEWISALK